MIKVLSVIGTRPEAIKMAPIVRELERHPDVFESRVCVTHQHREMLDPMLELFGLEAHHDLDVMKPGQSASGVTQSVLAGMDRVLESDEPDWVLIQGDTTTAMAASMAAFYRKACVGHVEAGLRTFDKYSPYPEEINRRVAGVLADAHFAPTEWAANNLRREGVPEEKVYITGNTVIDSLRHVRNLAFDPAGTPLENLPFGRKRVVLVTAHRNENFGEGMRSICHGLRELTVRHPDLHLAYPVHMNPRAAQAARDILSGLPSVSLLPPLEYQELVWLLGRAHFVITDSGGLQEEAAGIGKPVLVLRESTERPEGVDAGIAKLVGSDRGELVTHASALLRDPMVYHAMASSPCPYGDGAAAEKVVQGLLGRRLAPAQAEHIYEEPRPGHPLDALLHHATQEIPQHYADQVISRFKRRSREEAHR